MTSFDAGDDLAGATFTDTDLRGARFLRADMSGVSLRGVELRDAEIEAPWLLEEGSSLTVNGVDVAPLVDAALDARFPGRELRSAADPEALRAAWAAVERTWAATMERAGGLSEADLDVQVDGEWSFAQTLRHLVMATDIWLRKAVLEVEQPLHPLGQPYAEFEADGHDASVLSSAHPTYAEVLEARADRVAMVREFLASVTAEDLAVVRRNPHAPEHEQSTLSCLQVILREEWEHHRYAVRDLDTLAAR